MKIEKLTEDKIRVIINFEDVNLKNFDFGRLMTKPEINHSFILDILEQAKKEVNFNTDGCKLMIEAFSSDNILVFTITRYLYDNNLVKKKLIAKRKSFPSKSPQVICRFSNLDCFCNFCHSIQNLHKLNIEQIAKSNCLYLLHDTYFLVLKNINVNYENINLFYSVLSEFGKIEPFSSAFEGKLLEHGKVIIKNSAINNAIDFL